VHRLRGERRQDAVALDHDRLSRVDMVGDHDLESAAHVARHGPQPVERFLERDGCHGLTREVAEFVSGAGRERLAEDEAEVVDLARRSPEPGGDPRSDPRLARGAGAADEEDVPPTRHG
jgi:hypothetical protein